MQNLSITQNLNQKLSPQQIQFMKLLQVSSSNIEGIIKKELEANPALEEESNDLSIELVDPRITIFFFIFSLRFDKKYKKMEKQKSFHQYDLKSLHDLELIFQCS